MDEEIARSLESLSPHLDLALHELEMRDYFRGALGVSDVISPALINRLIGDNEYDCD